MKFFFNKFNSDKTYSRLSNDEESLLLKINIGKDLALVIKDETRNNVEGLYEIQMFDDYTDEPKLKGIKSKIYDNVTMPKLYKKVKNLQANDNFSDYHIFSCGHYGSDKDYFLGGIRTKDQFECLRVFETNGINYNIETSDIIAFLSKWQRQANFSIIDAYFDRVVIQLSDYNFHLDEFANESMEICPDFLSVIEDVEQMKKYIFDRKGEVDFWWD